MSCFSFKDITMSSLLLSFLRMSRQEKPWQCLPKKVPHGQYEKKNDEMSFCSERKACLRQEPMQAGGGVVVVVGTEKRQCLSACHCHACLISFSLIGRAGAAKQTGNQKRLHLPAFLSPQDTHPHEALFSFLFCHGAAACASVPLPAASLPLCKASSLLSCSLQNRGLREGLGRGFLRQEAVFACTAPDHHATFLPSTSQPCHGRK